MVKIIELITSKPIMKILDFLFRNPTKEFSQSLLISKLEIAKATAIKALNYLEKNDLVLTRRIGRSKLYRLNRHNFLVTQLKRFFNLNSRILKEFVKKVEAKKIIVFGSYASGEDTETSDIDVLIITDLDDRIIQKVALDLSKKFGKKLSVIKRTPEEFIKMEKREKTLWEKAVLQGVVIYEA